MIQHLCLLQKEIMKIILTEYDLLDIHKPYQNIN